MTVSSLWAALDEAGCGTPVSIHDFNLRGRGGVGNGSGDPEEKKKQQTILAVDLSIWICEGISSTALSTFHADPALYLVYQRATKLLKLGLGLVFVVEGQRRVFVRSALTASSSTSSSSSSSSSAFQQTTHELKSRRSGSQFWEASKRCESMLQSLGVPVVHAEAEGEALCALLNSLGLVDGVISNDGDCFLFGAKSVYTNFSSENLEHRQVMRYDISKLAFAWSGNDSSTTMKLSREDLIAFGIICGSDMCGDGLPHCGHKKAIQFLHACRNVKGQQCHGGRACLDELLSWSDIVTAAAGASTEIRDVHVDCDDDGPCTVPLRCCSICLHSGDKLQHERHGCIECGTGPGEGCCVVSSNEKFLRSMKEKALRSRGSLAPRHIVDQYFSPNSNHVPSSLRVLLSKPYVVSPDAKLLFTTSMILKGRTKESSHEYIKSTLPKLLARLDLWDTRPRNNYVTSTSKLRYKPIPQRIEKRVVRQSWPCYEITWSINIGVAEDEQFQFNTFDCQSVVDAVLPQLVKSFYREERRILQGRAEEERRKHFTGANVRKSHASRRNAQLQNQRRDATRNPQAGQRRRKRDRNFDVSRIGKLPKTSADPPSSSGYGLDVSLLIDSLPDASLGSDIEDIELDEQVEESDVNECDQSLVYDDTREEVDEYYDSTEMLTDCANSSTDIYRRSWSSCAGYTSQCYSSEEDLHNILFTSSNLLDTHDALGYDDNHHSMQPEEGIVEHEYPYVQPLPSSWGENMKSYTESYGCDDGYLSSSELYQHSEYHSLDSLNGRVFCDMGIRIEMTPIL
ncbi:hypothetical protein ACHAXH_003137, partial [Discostella pseudostelligera]